MDAPGHGHVLARLPARVHPDPEGRCHRLRAEETMSNDRDDAQGRAETTPFDRQAGEHPDPWRVPPGGGPAATGSTAWGADPGPQYGRPQYEQPQYGQPQHGPPQYGPQYGYSGYAQPGYGQLGYGQQYAQPP